MDQKEKSIYFCGIGGIGMSSLARIASKMGYKIYGSDLKENKNVIKLKKENFDIKIGQKKENLNNIDIELFIYSSAVKKDENEEYIYALENNIKMMSRGEFLSYVIDQFYNNIIIAGTHGKTTTTSLAGFLFNKLGISSSVLVGGIMKNYDNNCKISDSNNLIIVESDESDNSFLLINSKIAIITSIEEDHMECHKDFEGVFKNFFYFANAVEKKIIICNEYEYCRKIITSSSDHSKFLTYGIERESDIMAKNIKELKDGFNFDLFYGNKIIAKSVYLPMLGKHNILNALAAFGALFAFEESVFFENFKEIFSDFKGIDNRFNIEAKIKDHIFVNDYAHNPRKIESCINSAIHLRNNNEELKNHKIVLILEPHRYTRVSYLIDQFVQSVKGADEAIIIDIYSAFEEPIEGIDSNFISKKMQNDSINATYIPTDIQKIADYINKKDQNSIFVYASAGNTDFLRKALDLCKEVN